MKENTPRARRARTKRGKLVRLGNVLTLTPRQTVELTGMGINATYTLLRNGQMPALVVGKRFFIPKSALIRWLETGENPLSKTSDRRSPIGAA
jgi:excisionase family DNA binding protein